MSANNVRPTYTGPHVLIEGRRRYPLLMSSGEAAAWLGTTEHGLRDRADELPLTPVRLGRLWKWSTLEVARLCGLHAEVVTGPDDKAVPA